MSFLKENKISLAAYVMMIHDYVFLKRLIDGVSLTDVTDYDDGASGVEIASWLYGYSALKSIVDHGAV